MGNADYGHYFNVFNFTLILQFINDFGIQNYTNRLISQNREESSTIVQPLVGFKIVLSIIYLLATTICAWIWYGEGLDLAFILHLAFNQILISLIFFLRANISGLGFYKLDSFISILDRLLMIIIMGFILYTPLLQDKISISTFVYVQSISLFICVVISGSILIGHKYDFKLIRIQKSEFWKVLKICFPFALIYLTSSLFMKADSIWLEKYLTNGHEEAGIYASCYRLYDVLTIISLSFGSLLLAMFARLHNDLEKIKQLLSTSISILWIIALFCGFTGFFYSEELNLFLNKSNSVYSQKIISILLVTFIPGSINYIFGAYYQASHREVLLYKIYGSIAIISIVLNYFSIPSVKAIGCASSFLIVQLILSIVSIIFIKNELKVLFALKYKLLLFSTGLGLIYYVISSQLNLFYLYEWIIIGFIGIGLLFLSRIISLEIGRAHV